ncbi:hypothetical protein NDU88_002374 [Pleurodeles waltl]|uniref:Uncharacterized protein n=1 Tax=Pleurodeles waltl TaxID=8319 RepID=A0AAV7TKC9_PLEWA|nr:hypothetical protein NDU88_002374 [Pleurodeles waltl]
MATRSPSEVRTGHRATLIVHPLPLTFDYPRGLQAQPNPLWDPAVAGTAATQGITLRLSDPLHPWACQAPRQPCHSRRGVRSVTQGPVSPRVRYFS